MHRRGRRPLIYLDTNAYFRPFDDQSKAKIREESEACVRILQMVHEGRFHLLTSQVLDAEVDVVADDVKKLYVRGLLEEYSYEHIPLNEDVHSLSRPLIDDLGVSPFDALHIASASQGGAVYFITCDKDLYLSGKRVVERTLDSRGFQIEILNPREFLRRVSVK